MVPWRWVCPEFSTKYNYMSDRIQFTWIGFANNAKLAELEACCSTRKEFKIFLKKWLQKYDAIE